MRGDVAGDCDEDAPALVGIAPNPELPHPGLQHLVGMESGVFPKHCMRERGDQRLWGMAKGLMADDQSCRKIDLSLAVKRVEQGSTDRLRLGWKVVQALVALAREASR